MTFLNVHSRRNWSSGPEEVQIFMTSKSLSKDDNDDESINESGKTEEEEDFADATDLQPFFLFINVISKNVMSASQQTQLMREPLSDEQLQTAREEHIDELTNESAETASDIASVSESIASSTNSSRKRDKDFAPIIVGRNTRSKAGKLSSMNYKKLHGYSDANWIGTKDDRFSISDHIFFVVEESVSWSFKRQDHIVMFSCESEYYALAEAGKKVV